MRQIAYVAAFIVLIACAAPPAQPSDPREGSHVNMTGLVERLMPLLRNARSAGRVDYRGVCDMDTGFARLTFPDTNLRVSSRGMTGLDAIRNLLPAEAVVVQKPGIISIRLGNVPDEILRTQISHLKFTSDEQFTDSLAIMAISRNPDVQAASKRLGYSLPIEDVSIFPVSAREGLPHLPQSLSGVTFDQALNGVAKTFGGIVFFGACEDQHLYLVQSRRV
jgi:hypothetical protein